MFLRKFFDKVGFGFSCVEILQKMSFYAVASGRKMGVYKTWKECEEQVKGFTGAKFKKFSTLQEAQQFAGIQLCQPDSTNSSMPASKWTSYSRDFSSQPELSKSNTPAQGKGQKCYYAVAKGHNVGVYLSWAECQAQVEGFSYPKYRKFPTLQEAEEFIKNSANKASTSKSNSQTTIPSKFTKDNNAGENLFSTSFGGYQFSQDDQGYIHCFTDGSCESNGRVNARAGIGVWFGSNHPLNVGEPVNGPPTNNVAEIQAATKAIQLAKSCGVNKLQINTDSQFMIKCVTEWMPKWKKNGWRLSTGGEVKNKEQLVELDKAMKEGVQVKWNYVQAHIGIEGNEHADQLARSGAAKFKNMSKVSESGRYKPY